MGNEDSKILHKGALAYEIIFGKKTSNSVQLLFGQKNVRPEIYDVRDYLRARSHRNDLALLFAKRNLHAQILRQ